MNNKMRILGEQLKKDLENYFNTKVEIAYVNEDYNSVSQGFMIYLYLDKYNYKKIGLNYLPCLDTNDYIGSVKYALENNRFDIHIASIEEIYISQILKKNTIHDLYIFDGWLMGNGYEIDLNDVDYFSHDKMNSLLEIWSDEEKFEIDLLDETIEFIEPDCKIEKAEPIDNKFMNKLCDSWNRIKDTWCTLSYSNKDECLKLKDIETGNITTLAALDDINYIKLDEREKKLIVEYDEDEYGFTGFTLSTVGIEY